MQFKVSLGPAGEDFEDVSCDNGAMPFLYPLLRCGMTKTIRGKNSVAPPISVTIYFVWPTVQSALRTRRAINSTFVTTVGDGNQPQKALVIPKGAFCISKMCNEESKKYALFLYPSGIIYWQKIIINHRYTTPNGVEQHHRRHFFYGYATVTAPGILFYFYLFIFRLTQPKIRTNHQHFFVS